MSTEYTKGTLVKMMKKNLDYKLISNFLYQIIDNIDTLDDVAKDNHKVYRELVRGQIERAHEIATSDGYEIVFHKNPKSVYEV